MLKNKYCSPINCLFTHLLLFMSDIFWAYFLLHPGLKEQSDLYRLNCSSFVHYLQRTIPLYFEYIIGFLNVPLFFLQPKNVLCVCAHVCVCLCVFVCVCVCCVCFRLYRKSFQEQNTANTSQFIQGNNFITKEIRNILERKKAIKYICTCKHGRKVIFSISIPFSFSMILNIVSSCEGVRKQEMLL